MSRRRRALKWTEFIALGGPCAPTESFIICVLRGEMGRDDPRLAPLLAAGGALERVRIGYCYAGTIASLPWGERARAYPIMTALLRAGINIFTQNYMPVNVDADALTEEAPVLTPASLERYHVRQTRAKIEEDLRHDDGHWRSRQRVFDTYISHQECRYTHASAWCTDEGRAFVAWILDALSKRAADLSSDEEVFTDTEEEEKEKKTKTGATPLPTRADVPLERPPPPQGTKRPASEVIDLTTIGKEEEDDGAKPPPAKKARLNERGEEEGEEEAVCMVCMDRRPNTLVLPCMHVVVCVACSERLKGTPNARQCIYCRQPIESVQQDDGVASLNDD